MAGAPVELSAGELVVTETPRSGWAVATDAGETVALDLTVTPQLRRAGLAREVVRLVQDARKASGLEVTDRIALSWTADDGSSDVAEALREHAGPVAGEVLATSFTEVASVQGPDAPAGRRARAGLLVPAQLTGSAPGTAVEPAPGRIVGPSQELAHQALRRGARVHDRDPAEPAVHRVRDDRVRGGVVMAVGGPARVASDQLDAVPERVSRRR